MHTQPLPGLESSPNLAHPRCAVDLDDGETEAESAAEEEEGEARCALQVPAGFEVDDID